MARADSPELRALVAEYLTRIGTRLRELRKLRELSTYQVEQLCGVGYSQTADIERGQKNTSIRTLVRLSDAIGAPLHELFVPEPLRQVHRLEDLRRTRIKPTDPKREAGVRKHLTYMGARIAEFRQLQGLLPQQMEEYAGIASHQLAALERGQSNTSLRTAIVIADTLGVQLHELFIPAELSGVRTKASGQSDEEGEERREARTPSKTGSL